MICPCCNLGRRKKKGRNKVHKTFMYTAIGVALGLMLNTTIAGFVNPILTPVKLSVSLAG